ncbi:MAG: ATP-dependent 6-phosphofructokinase [Bdellovibrio sp.]
MKIGLLTGGGDAPGLNGIIEAVTKTLLHHGHDVVGLCDGFEGVFNQNIKQLNLKDVEGLHAMAGTLLGTSNKTGTKGREDEFRSQLKKLRLDVLIAAGGDGTFRGLSDFSQDIPLIGVPKTIDNDLPGTDVTFGFDTACTVVQEAIESLKATADAHRRIFFVETMGRTAGWIALRGGLTGYADLILLPEFPIQIKQLITVVKEKLKKSRGLVICVAEGAHISGEKVLVQKIVEGSPQAERYGGIAHHLATLVEQETSEECRHVVLGHLQRSRFPTTADRMLTLSMGVEAARMAIEKDFNKAVVTLDGKIKRVPIETFFAPVKEVQAQHEWVQLARELEMMI